MSRTTKLKTHIISLLKVLFAGTIIYWLIKSGKLDFKGLSSLAQPIPVAICLSASLLTLLSGSERWLVILKNQGFLITRFEAFRLSMIGAFFNFVIPGGVGGDVMKGYYIAKNNPTDRVRAVVTIAMDRLLGLFAMLTLAITVMFLDFETVKNQPQLKTILALLIALFIGFMVFWSIIFSRRLSSLPIIEKMIGYLPKSDKFLKLYRSLISYSNLKRAFFSSIFWSLLAQSISILQFVYIGHMLGFSEVSFHTYFFVVPIGFMITAIPISPAGVGVGQAAFYFLFNLALGKEVSLGSTAVTAFQIFAFMSGLVGAFFYITHRKVVIPDESTL